MEKGDYDKNIFETFKANPNETFLILWEVFL